MAESDHALGYQCEFIDTVHDNFYCKKCSLVARRLILTSCCGESYCHACIADIQHEDKPCQECGQQILTTIKPLKYQRQMDCLKVYCCMRGRGCSWSGMLGQLDAHLDSELNNCQYVDINCPLNCWQTTPRNKMDQHVSMECVKREHVCQYCDFKSTYEVMVDTHWPQCIYFPLQCPNYCGVTCERDVIEDHMRICRLEELACEFSGVGCVGRFRREDQEEHARQNNQKHLTMTAAAAVKMRQQLQQKLLEQEEKLQEQGLKLKSKFEDQEKRFQDQELKLQEEKQRIEMKFRQQEQKFEKKLEEQEQNFRKLLQEQDEKFVELQKKSEHNEVVVKEVTNFINLKRTFAMENFSKEKGKDYSDWKSPAMYSHLCGYRFCIGIDANGYGGSLGNAMRVYLCSMQGEYDHQLKWPTHASFTLELLNQHGGENIIRTLTRVQLLESKTPCVHICSFGHIKYGLFCASFLEHSELADFLANDTLYFHLSNIIVY